MFIIRSASRFCRPSACLASGLVLLNCLFSGVGFPPLSRIQVNFPNGGVSENVVALRVTTLDGVVTLDRQFEEWRWRINRRWNQARGEARLLGGRTASLSGTQYSWAAIHWRLKFKLVRYGNRNDVVTRASADFGLWATYA